MPNKPHSASLRRGRCSEGGRIYHITTATDQRRPVFTDLLAGRTAILQLRQCDQLGLSQTWAFVLMPDHLHWLVELRDNHLDALIRRFKSISAREVNRLIGRAGQRLWQPGFHDHAIRSHEDLRKVARYLIMNPLRAGLVAHVGLYPHWDAVWL